MAVTKTTGRGPAAARAASRARRHMRVRKKITGSAAFVRYDVDKGALELSGTEDADEEEEPEDDTDEVDEDPVDEEPEE